MRPKIQLLKHRINQTLSQVLSGTQPLTWFGPGTLTLTGANTYTGAIAVNAGTLYITNGTSHVNSTGAITVASGATFSFSQNFGGNNLTNNLNLSGSGTSATQGALNIQGNSTASGTITLASDATITHDYNYATLSGSIVTGGNALTLKTTANGQPPLTVSGAISGSGSLTVNGAANTGGYSVRLSGVNTYTGATTITAGILEIGGQLASGNYSGTISDNGTLKINSSANQTLGGIISGAGSLVKDNSGTLTLTGNNTLSGAVTINNGILVGAGINAPQSALGTASSITVNNGGTFRSGSADNSLIGYGGGSNAAITLNAGGVLDTSTNINANHLRAITFSGGTLGGTGALSGISASHGRWNLDQTVTVSAASGVTSTISAIGVTLSQSGGTVFNVNASGAASGIDLDVSGSFYHAGGAADTGLIKNGAGVIRLSGANTYTGTTTVSAGTLTISNASGLGTGAVSVNGTLTYTVDTTGTRTVTVNSGGVINKGGFTHTGTTFVNNGGTINA